MLSSSVSAYGTVQTLNNQWAHTKQTLSNIASGQNLSLLQESPGAYAAAVDYQSSADTLTAAQPGLSLASGSLSLASGALSNVNKVLQAMQQVAQNALSTPSPEVRSDLQTQYNAMASQINNLVNNASINGINLVSANPSTLAVSPAGAAGSTQTINGVASNAASLGITTANWSSAAGIEASLGQVESAAGTVQSTMAGFGAPMAAVDTAQSMNASTILSSQSSADSLTSDDLGSEAVSLAGEKTQRASSIAALQGYIKTQEAVLGLFKKG
jgi:flagellin-like hook-associated protein FlgL